MITQIIQSKMNSNNNKIKDQVEEKTLLLKDVVFDLPKSFLKKYMRKQPNWGALGYIIYKRTYARIKNGIDFDFDSYIYEKLDINNNLIYFSRVSKNKLTKNMDLINKLTNNSQIIEEIKNEPNNIHKKYVILYNRINDSEFQSIELITENEFQIRTLDESDEKLTLTNKTEEFWETLKRVVEGVFRIQKWYCKNPQNNYQWKERKAKETAMKMYDAMWNFKFLPAGRCLWMMGTPFVEKNGSMSLNNCGFTSTQNLIEEGNKPFRWTMDSLMLGVGVGFDVLGGMKVPKICDVITYEEAEKIAQVKVKNMPMQEIKFVVDNIQEELKNKLSEYIYINNDVKNKLSKEEFENLYTQELYVQYYTNELVKKDREKENQLIKETLTKQYNELPQNEKERYIIIKKPILLDETYVVPDSREGWVNAIGYVCNAFFFSEKEMIENKELMLSDPEYDGAPIFIGLPKFDYSKIRKKGELIRGFGGTASGPEPLIDLIEDISQILTERIGEPLRTVDIIDICTNLGKCVVAGNVRRSALISLGEIDDYGFINKKSQEMIKYNHINAKWRDAYWASNNSVKCKVGDDYTEISKLIEKNGEPGIVWLDNAREYGRMREDERNFDDMKVMGVNPCGEQSLEDKELCNLCETFPSLHDSWEEYAETIELAFLFAKSVTLLNTHWSETNSVMHKNRRIGISQSGIIDAIVKHGRHEMMEWCKKGYDLIKELDINNTFLCINKSKKYTTVKPSGCMIKDTLVNTKTGIYRLEELGNINGIEWQDISFKTTCDKEITKFYVNGKVPTKIIKTITGNELESTYIHKFKVYDGDINESIDCNKIIWKEAKDLKQGDQLLCILNDYYNDDEPKLKVEEFDYNDHEEKIIQPEYINDELAWIIGYMFSNGTVINEKIYLYVSNIHKDKKKLIDLIINMIKRQFNIKPTLEDNENICINSKQVIQFLTNNNLLIDRSKDLKVPYLIRTSSRYSIQAFIDGLWRNYTKECKENSTWTLHSLNKNYILELLVLCRSVGINVKISSTGNMENNTKRWFLQSIHSNYDKEQIMSNNLRSKSYIKNGKTYWKENINDGFIYWLDEITEIVNSTNYTYDISVPDTNEYIANGVVSHNTLSLLAGVSPGIHYPHSEYYIRRVRIDSLSPIIKECKRCGYNVYDEPFSEQIIKDGDNEYKIYHTKIVEFPMKVNHFNRSKDDVSFLEQVMNAIDLQKNWSDNQISITATFTKKEAEAGLIKYGLEFAQHYLKGISCLPLSEHGYINAPYETITKEQYEKMKEQITDDLDLTKIDLDQGEGERFCSNDSCEINSK